MSPDVTILVPVFNEEDNILPLVRATCTVMRGMGCAFELLYVDDGSTDATPERLRQAAAETPELRVLRLRGNCGQTAALAAGFDHARGRFVVTMDGDCQNDPEDIPNILMLLEEGYDLVVGWRRDRKDRFFSRRLPSRIANRLLSALTHVRVHDFGCTLKGYRASFIERLPIYSEMHRYIPALAMAVGARVREVVVHHHPRRSGRSKYGIGRTVRVFYDLVALRMLTRFAARPLHWFGLGSIPCFLLAVVLGFFTFVDHTHLALIDYSTFVFPTALGLMLYLCVHFVMIGLLAELAVHVLRTRGERFVVRLLEASEVES